MPRVEYGLFQPSKVGDGVVEVVEKWKERDGGGGGGGGGVSGTWSDRVPEVRSRYNKLTFLL